MKKLQHGQLLNAKHVMDNAMGVLSDLDDLVPKALHRKLGQIIAEFESELADSDVADRYEEIR